jgi:hypothetical protein
MKRLLFALVVTGVVGISPMANATLVSAGTMILTSQSCGQGNFSVVAHLVGDGVEINTGGRDGGSSLGGTCKDFGLGQSTRANFVLCCSSIVDFLQNGAGSNFLDVNTSQFTFTAGQLTYSGTFDFTGSLCTARGREGSGPPNCDILYFPSLEGHGFFEAVFDWYPPGTRTPLGSFVMTRTTYTFVPEPATLGLLGIGLAGIGFARRKNARITA